MMFRKLVAVELAHGYYKSGFCTDLSVLPCQETALKLKNYKLQFKPTAVGFILMAKVVENKALVSIPQNERFAFTLQAQHKNFRSFTQWACSGPISFIENSKKDTCIGQIHLPLEALYTADKLNFDTHFTLYFKPPKTSWEYLILTDNDLQEKDVEITQNSLSGKNLQFNKAKALTTDTTIPQAKLLLAQFPNKKLFYVSSTKRVSLSEVKRKNIELRIEKKVVNHNLPNPSTHGQLVVVRCIN